MFKLVRFPSKLENFFSSLKSEFLFGHFEYFRMLALLIAIKREDTNISSLCPCSPKVYRTALRLNGWPHSERVPPAFSPPLETPTSTISPYCSCLSP